VPESGFGGFGIGSGLRRHLRLVWAALRLSVLRALEYRVGFWTEAVVGVAWSLAGMAPLLVALEHRPDIAGWGAWEVVMLTGFYMIMSGAYASLLEPALFETMDKIRRGTLDYLLLRPVDSLVSCLVSAFQPWALLEVGAGMAVVLVAALRLEVDPSWAQLGSMLAVLVSGGVALYALGVFILSASFRAMQLQNLGFLLETVLSFGRWPIDVFRGPLRAVFTFVVPLGVMTSFPAAALLGRLGAQEVCGALVSALVLAISARLSWRRGLSGYTSASS